MKGRIRRRYIKCIGGMLCVALLCFNNGERMTFIRSLSSNITSGQLESLRLHMGGLLSLDEKDIRQVSGDMSETLQDNGISVNMMGIPIKQISCNRREDIWLMPGGMPIGVSLYADGVLVVGLGNRSITPDSLGPRVAERIYVTRHINEYMPDALPRPVRSVCSVAPGVLGVTGVETMEIDRGVAEHIKPDLIIAIDALASRRAARISTTIQLTDTGISPGSGVGNTRKGLTSQAFGVPVIAIGVPMVVHAATISQEVISLIADKTGLHGDEEKLRGLAAEVISESLGPLVVTPKDIDTIAEDMSRVIADAINLALFKADYEDVRMLIA